MEGISGRLVSVAVLAWACLGGCSYDTQCRVENRVGTMSGCPLDATPPPSPPAMSSPAATLDSNRPLLPAPPANPVGSAEVGGGANRLCAAPEAAGVCRAAAYEAPASPAPASAQPRIVAPLDIPSAIPGSTAPPLRLPPVRPGETLAEQRDAIESLFSALQVIPPRPPAVLRRAKCR